MNGQYHALGEAWVQLGRKATRVGRTAEAVAWKFEIEPGSENYTYWVDVFETLLSLSTIGMLRL